MKGGFAVAAMAAMASGASALKHNHGHELFHKRAETEMCGCTTIYTTVTGEPTLCPPAPVTTSSTPTTTSTPTPTSTSTPTPTPTTPTSTAIVKLPVPTPEPITCPTPGTYTITATTVTLSETTTVCGATSTHVTPGTHTVGGVTTVVDVATTVTCPVATTTEMSGVVTSVLTSTEYVCPSAGTYTIAPVTLTVTEECDVEYPIPTSYNPGTYTAPEMVITVTDTNYVTVCPYTSSETPTPTPTPEPLPEPVPAPAPKPVTTSVAAPPPPPPKEEKPKAPKTGGKFSGSFGSSGDHYGITYTPYDGQSGACKSGDAVDKDIAEIKKDGFTVVRVYSTDCNTLETVGSACKKHGMEMIIGIFVKETGCSADTPDVKEQIDAIASWAEWDMVKLFIVGNEAIMNGFCTASELRELVTVVKSTCSGYDGPYTIAETLDSWMDITTSSALCDVIDFTGANIHPFFNAENLASMAGVFVKGQLSILENICPGKTPVNLECGWPTGGNCLGSACPGKAEQAEALKSIREEVGDRTVFFSFEDDKWKEPGAYNCEQFWGARSYFDNL